MIKSHQSPDMLQDTLVAHSGHITSPLGVSAWVAVKSSARAASQPGLLTVLLWSAHLAYVDPRASK